MFDTHCHPTDVDHPEQVLADAHAAGVHTVLTCGYNSESNKAVCDLATKVQSLTFALGLHPWFADQNVDAVIHEIATHRPTAIGEIGLDLHDNPPCPPIDRQIQVLEAQLQCAVRMGLPVTIHSRKAVQYLLPVLRNHPGIRGALHAFSGSYEQAKPFLNIGLYIGVCGSITRPQAKRVRRCASQLPLDRILLETDAPAIGMNTIAPPHVRPSHLSHVRDGLADIRSIAPSDVEQATDANARALFG
ncbi:MAG: TatD family hydrolase [Polyangiaceae bacterium]|nr:TatD family hydrolase [Polyangiaceae bacterium]